MKKPITLLLLSSAVFFTVSCNKKGDWKCTCKKNGDIVFQSLAHDAKKKGEKEACEKMETEIQGAECQLSK